MVSGVVPAEVSWSSLKQVGIINLSLMVQPLELLGTANVGGEGGGGGGEEKVSRKLPT